MDEEEGSTFKILLSLSKIPLSFSLFPIPFIALILSKFIPSYFAFFALFCG